MKNSELKPCPFCGGKKVRVHEGFSHECAQVVCDTCDISVNSSEEYEASGTLWNTRPAEAELQARIAELEAALHKAKFEDACRFG